MSKITAIYNVNSNEWSVESSDPNPMHVDIIFSVTSDSEVTQIDGLTFGYTLNSNSIPVSSQFFPTYGVRYSSTDSGKELEKTGIPVISNTLYELHITSELDSVTAEVSHTFSTPKPPQPASSWIWDDSTKKWNAPIPYPEGSTGPVKEWNEEEGCWQDVNADIPDTAPPAAPIPQ